MKTIRQILAPLLAVALLFSFLLTVPALVAAEENSDPEGAAEAENNSDEAAASEEAPLPATSTNGQGLLIASFGTSYDETRAASISAVRETLAQAFPERSLDICFTSTIIRGILDERGIHYPSPEEALDRLEAAGVKDLLVVPTHIMEGYEFQDTVDLLKKAQDRFQSIQLSHSLLGQDADYEELAQILIDEYGDLADAESAVVFMGHGTEHQANSTYARFQKTFKDLGAEHFLVGTVEGTPTLDDMLAAAKELGVKKVHLFPLMLVAGDHANNDMAGDEEDSWKMRFTAEGYSVEPHIQGLGELEAVRAMYLSHAQAAEDLDRYGKSALLLVDTPAEGLQAAVDKGLRTLRTNSVTDVRIIPGKDLSEADLALVEEAALTSYEQFGSIELSAKAEPEEADFVLLKPDMEKSAEGEAAASDAAETQAESEPAAADGSLADGLYEITVDSSSEMFKIVKAILMIKDGQPSCRITLSGTGYGKLFLGTGEEAAAADAAQWIPFEEDETGAYTYLLPEVKLDEAISVAAYSIRKDKWYDRELTFHSPLGAPQPLPEDGKLQAQQNPEATLASGAAVPAAGSVVLRLEGGSGRTQALSPARLMEENGQRYLELILSSAHYDYLQLDGQRIESTIKDGQSVFQLPLPEDVNELAFAANTTAMSKPHLIEYKLVLDWQASAAEKTGTPAPAVSPADDAAAPEEEAAVPDPGPDPLGNGLRVVRTLPLDYAKNFRVDYLEGDLALVTLHDGTRYLILPEGAEAPADLPADVVVLAQGLQRIYLQATAVMSFFDALDAYDHLSFSSLEAEDWYFDSAREMMQKGRVCFAGKYKAPDYEMLLAGKASLTIASMMIFHAPEARDKLQELGIPVLIDYSSLESHPLGRVEWLKLYGLLVGKEELAEKLFNEEKVQVAEASADARTDRTVAFFYRNPSGQMVVRSGADYVAKMIDLAGGRYIFDESSLPKGHSSTVPLDVESFYAAARDADIFIYNSAIYGELDKLSDLLAEAPVLEGCKAIQNGNIWTCSKEFYQETMIVGPMITDLHQLLRNEDPTLEEIGSFRRVH